MTSNAAPVRRTEPVKRRQAAPPRSFGILLFTLAAALILNTVLGPLFSGVVDYPLSETLRNQLLGLEIVSVALVAPLSMASGLLAWRGHAAAAPLALGPTAYTVYMFLQYVLGPEYDTYTGTVFLHLTTFALGCVGSVWAWALAGPQRLPVLPRPRERLYGVMLVALSVFVVSRYHGAITGAVTGEAISAEFTDARTFYWSIFLLDLGVIVPGTAIAGVALVLGARHAHTALYAVIGWFALVPPSVASMAAVMAINDDPHGSVGQVIVLGLVAVLFAAFGAYVYRPLLSRTFPLPHRASAGSHEKTSVDAAGMSPRQQPPVGMGKP